MSARIFLIFFVLVLSACSRHNTDGPEAEGGRRPGGQGSEQPAQGAVEAGPAYFADGNPTKVVSGSDGKADVVLTILRDNYLEAPESSVTVQANNGSSATAVFPAHKGAAEMAFRISASTVFTIAGSVGTAPGPRTWTVELVQNTTEQPAFTSGVFLTGGRAVEVAVDISQNESITHFAITGENLTRDWTLNDGDLRADGTALYNNVKNTARPDEGFYAVLVDDGEAEYLLLDGYDEGFSAPEAWKFVDGWLVGHIAFESYLVNPENAPWTVWVRRGPDCLRVLDLYHGESLTARYNMASPGALVDIKITNDGKAVLERQPAGFAHPDIFAYELEISGEGIYDGAGEVYIRDPMYTDIDGNLNSWPTRQASRLSVQH